MKNGEDAFLARINAGERRAFHELFGEYYRSLVVFAMRYVGAKEDAEDVVQDLFVSIWEKGEKFLSVRSLHTFLYNSVRNTCLNLLKHRKVEEKYLNYSMMFEEFSEDNDYEVLEDELYRRLFQVIEELPPRCREVFMLHLEGRKNEEIAGLLEISLLTVKTQKKKALRYIRERLGAIMFYLLGVG